MASVRKGKDDEDQSRHNRAETPPVHANSIVLIMKITRDSEEAREGDAKDDDGADPEVPPPSHEVCGHSAHEDAEIEAQTGKGTPDGEDEVLAWAGTVRLTQESEAGGGESRRSNALEGTTDDEHDGVLAEAADERPDHEPDVAEQEDGTSAVDVAQA